MAKGNAIVGYVFPLVRSKSEFVPCRVFTYFTRSTACADMRQQKEKQKMKNRKKRHFIIPLIIGF
jgi:hypothetical protein